MKFFSYGERTGAARNSLQLFSGHPLTCRAFIDRCLKTQIDCQMFIQIITGKPDSCMTSSKIFILRSLPLLPLNGTGQTQLTMGWLLFETSSFMTAKWGLNKIFFKKPIAHSFWLTASPLLP